MSAVQQLKMQLHQVSMDANVSRDRHRSSNWDLGTRPLGFR